jgi:peroxiredoxin
MTFERFLLFAVAAIFVVAAVQMLDTGSGSAMEARPAPDFSLPALRREQPWQLSDLKGRVAVISFWASWCGPCRMELPGLQEMHEDYKDRGATVLAINRGEERTTVKGFIDAEGYTMPVALDEAGTAARKYNVAGIPRLLIIAPDGTIVHDRTGYRRGQEEDIREIIEDHLPETQPAQAPAGPEPSNEPR